MIASAQVWKPLTWARNCPISARQGLISSVFFTLLFLIQATEVIVSSIPNSAHYCSWTQTDFEGQSSVQKNQLLLILLKGCDSFCCLPKLTHVLETLTLSTNWSSLWQITIRLILRPKGFCPELAVTRWPGKFAKDWLVKQIRHRLKLMLKGLRHWQMTRRGQIDWCSAAGEFWQWLALTGSKTSWQHLDDPVSS